MKILTEVQNILTSRAIHIVNKIYVIYDICNYLNLFIIPYTHDIVHPCAKVLTTFKFN